MARRKRGSISSYWKGVFESHPEWVKVKRNEDAMAQYRVDHGMKPDAPIKKNILQGMANVKSSFRKGGAKSTGTKKLVKVKVAVAADRFEALEELIDKCLSMARGLDHAKLDSVVKDLRRARNDVILAQG